MVLDSNGAHVLSEHGNHISELKLEGCSSLSRPRIAFHNSSRHFVIAGAKNDCLYVKVYTKDGEFVRSIQIHEGRISHFVRGLAVSTDGRIAVVCYQFEYEQFKVYVVLKT